MRKTVTLPGVSGRTTQFFRHSSMEDNGRAPGFLTFGGHFAQAEAEFLGCFSREISRDLRICKYAAKIVQITEVNI
jgi:hypothetical protein